MKRPATLILATICAVCCLVYGFNLLPEVDYGKYFSGKNQPLPSAYLAQSSDTHDNVYPRPIAESLPKDADQKWDLEQAKLQRMKN